MITDEERENLVDFFKACNEMIEGRFILSDTKVSNILKSVVKSPVLYPASLSMQDKAVEVEPFPLVPTICTNLSFL